MRYKHWRLMVIVLMSLTPAHGHEACYNESWTYHGHTHSCFKLMRINLRWPEARDNCLQVQLGKSYGVITRLAKIDDRETNDFITRMLPSGWMCWIGLSYQTDIKDFRWDGYPDEVPKFTAIDWRFKTKPYVSIFISGWKEEYPFTQRYFVCQHTASPPSYCSETSSNLTFVVKPGIFQTVSFCVVAYSMTFSGLLKHSKIGWNTQKRYGVKITNATMFESHQNVTITFPVLGPSQLGKYALEFSVRSGATFSGLYFQLTAPLTHCNGMERTVHEVTIGQPVILNMCVTAFPSPSNLLMQKANGTSWLDYTNPNVTITTDVDFDTLTNVRIIFYDVKAMDIGEYRLLDSQEATGVSSSHLKFSLSGALSKAPVCSSFLRKGTIVGLIVASGVVAIILTILTMITFRKLRKRNKHKTKQASGSGRVSVGFHKPEEEATDSECVEVHEQANLPGKDFRAPPKNKPERSVYEGEEAQSVDTTTYETIKHTEGEEDARAKKEYYDILHADDPNYENLNRERSRKYETIGDIDPSGAYESPTPAM